MITMNHINVIFGTMWVAKYFSCTQSYNGKVTCLSRICWLIRWVRTCYWALLWDVTEKLRKSSYKQEWPNSTPWPSFPIWAGVYIKTKPIKIMETVLQSKWKIRSLQIILLNYKSAYSNSSWGMNILYNYPSPIKLNKLHWAKILCQTQQVQRLLKHDLTHWSYNKAIGKTSK